MSILRTFALLAIICLLWLFPARTYAMAGLKVKMRHAGVGSCDIYITKRAMKLICIDNNKYEIVARAPDWSVTTFNRTSKKASRMSFSGWRAFISELSDGWSIETRPDTVQDNVTLGGLPARRTTTPTAGRRLGWPKTLHTGQYVVEQAYFYNGTAVPHEIALIINQLFDQESATELVLGLALVKRDGKSFKQIWTDNSSTVDLPAKFFDVPPGLHDAELTQVFGNVTAMPSEIKDMIDGVGIGKKLGKQSASER